jgi:aldehyde:ferredoxin oxidoreductase
VDNFGFAGKILDVDLGSRKMQTVEMTSQDAVNFLGGAGFNARLLYQRCGDSTRPFDPENPVIFGAGPLVGTSFPASGRSTFTSLSPLTGIFGDASGGGFFGVKVKLAGYDHLVIQGVSSTPCYLLLQEDGQSTIEDASEFWGKDTMATDRLLREKYPGSAVACIGVAGEKLVHYANIVTNDGSNAWGRTGIGAVMGSKKLKAIVACGKGKLRVQDEAGMKRISEEMKRAVEELLPSRLFSQHGTMMVFNAHTAKGLMYGYNCRKRCTLQDAASLDIASFYKAVEWKKKGCYGCPVRCEQHFTIRGGAFQGEEGPKYDIVNPIMLGFNLGIQDISAVLHLSILANKLGLDIIEFGSVLATAIDLYKAGILDGSQLDGIALDWGNVEAIEKLTHKIIAREGIGDVLAQGLVKISQHLGQPAARYALHIKGMSEPAQSAPSYLLAYAVSTRGGDHLKGAPYLPDPSLAAGFFQGTKKSLDSFSHVDKGRSVWWHENYKIMQDSLGVCYFLAKTLLPAGYLLPHHLAQGFAAATGIHMDASGMLMAGERVYQLEKAFNAKRGISRTQDTCVRREEPDSWGQKIDLDHPCMLDEYYQYRGCSRDGLPLRERLAEVGLTDVADELASKDRLGQKPCLGEYKPIFVAAPFWESPAYQKEHRIKTGVMRFLARPWLFRLISNPGTLKFFARIMAAKRSLRAKEKK